MSEIGDVIKEARKRQKLTQKKLGEILGKGESTVRMWELGKSTPPAEIIPPLSTQLKLDYIELMGLAGYLNIELNSLLRTRDKLNQRRLGLKNRFKSARNRIDEIEFELNKFIDIDIEELPKNEREKFSNLVEERRKENSLLDNTRQKLEDLDVELWEINDSVRIALESKDTLNNDFSLHQNLPDSKKQIQLEDLFNSSYKISINNKELSKKELEKALQLLKITFS